MNKYIPAKIKKIKQWQKIQEDIVDQCFQLERKALDNNRMVRKGWTIFERIYFWLMGYSLKEIPTQYQQMISELESQREQHKANIKSLTDEMIFSIKQYPKIGQKLD